MQQLNTSVTSALEDVAGKKKYQDDHLINELNEADIENANKIDKMDIRKEYKLDSEDTNIFSPQIEVFAPFAAHVDASRSNMSAKQLLQIVNSKNNDIPFALNKNFKSLTNINSPYIEFAEDDGFVLSDAGEFLIIYYTTIKQIITKYVPKAKALVNNAVMLRYKRSKTVEESSFKKGEVLYDYTGQLINSSIPKIGYRANIMYGQFFGYTAEDAFVASEDFAKRAVIDYTKKVFIPITKLFKYFKNKNDKYFFDEGEILDENYLDYLKIDMSDSFLSEFTNTSDKKSKMYGRSVDALPGATITKVKVHIINTEKKFQDLEDEYIYNKGLISETLEMYNRQMDIKRQVYSDFKASLNEEYAIAYTNSAINKWETTEHFSKLTLEQIAQDYNIEHEMIDLVLEVEMVKDEKTCLGDKFANVYAGKGVCSLILPTHLMPKDEHGDPADIIFNPLGSFGRNNWGTMFEIAIARVVEDIQSVTYGKSSKETVDRLKFVNTHFIKKFDTEYYNEVKKLIATIKSSGNEWIEFKDDVLKNKFFLFIDTFPGITYNDFIRDFIIPYEEKFNINITKKHETVYSKELMQYMRDRGFASSVYTKDDVEEVKQNVFFGKNYWVKLFHTSYSKYNALGFASSYSKTTGEPPKGAKKKGGAHTSWQTTYALIGHKDKNAMLKELSTIKSSAIFDKNNFVRKIIKDGEYHLKDTYRSPTITTLNNALNMIMLEFDNVEQVSYAFSNVVEEMEEDLGINIEDLFESSAEDSEDRNEIGVEDDLEDIDYDIITGEVK
jgi:hypothetical protein